MLDSPYFVSEKSTKPLLASVAPERKAPLRPHSPRPRIAHAAERQFGCRKRGGRLYRDISNNSRPITPKIVGYQQKKIRSDRKSSRRVWPRIKKRLNSCMRNIRQKARKAISRSCLPNRKAGAVHSIRQHPLNKHGHFRH